MELRTELLVLSDFAYPTGLDVYVLYRVSHESGIIGIFKNECSLYSIRLQHYHFKPFSLINTTVLFHWCE
jgi:hypothetical protein